MLRHDTIATYYDPRLAYEPGPQDESRSPAKPRAWMEHLGRHGLRDQALEMCQVTPLERRDFELAHEPEYVQGYFEAGARTDVLGLTWTPALAESVRWTNGSLYQAVRRAVVEPERICLSPTSGFHHATPSRGALFCSFSGQVITSIKLWRELGVRGAWLDLDGHHGNSISDTRGFAPDLAHAIPKGWNVNIRETHEAYLDELRGWLHLLREEILAGRIDYVVWCHGADSHEDDDLGRQLTTEEWIACSEIFYGWVARLDAERGRPLPVAMSLFGGYRADDYESVLSLHTADLAVCLRQLCGRDVDPAPFLGRVRPRPDGRT